MKPKFRITFKLGQTTVATIEGLERDPALLTVEDVAERIIKLEAFVEKLTGLRCHVDQIG